MGLIYNKFEHKYEDELIVVCSSKGAKSYESIAELRREWCDNSSEMDGCRIAPDSPMKFDWGKAKKDLIETECGITLCRQDYSERYKRYFTFDEALEIEKEAKKHGFRLPTVVDFEKLYAFYGLDKDRGDTPQRFVDELGFSYSGVWDGTDSSAGHVGSNGVYWSSSVYDASCGYYLNFDSSHVYPQDRYYKSRGLTLKFIYEGKEE